MAMARNVVCPGRWFFILFILFILFIIVFFFVLGVLGMKGSEVKLLVENKS